MASLRTHWWQLMDHSLQGSNSHLTSGDHWCCYNWMLGFLKSLKVLSYMYSIHTVPFKVLGSIRFCFVFILCSQRLHLFHKKKVMWWYIIICFLLFLWWQSCIFSSHLVSEGSWDTEDWSNVLEYLAIMLTWCSRDISCYYQYRKQFCCNIFLMTLVFRIILLIEGLLNRIEIFCNIIHAFTVTRDQCNTALLNTSIDLLFIY